MGDVWASISPHHDGGDGWAGPSAVKVRVVERDEGFSAELVDRTLPGHTDGRWVVLTFDDLRKGRAVFRFGTQSFEGADAL